MNGGGLDDPPTSRIRYHLAVACRWPIRVWWPSRFATIPASHVTITDAHSNTDRKYDADRKRNAPPNTWRYSDADQVADACADVGGVRADGSAGGAGVFAGGVEGGTVTEVRILRGDVVRYCKLHKALGLPLFHAALLDCPYELGGKVSIDDALNVSKIGKGGFMMRDWDNTGIAFDPETWRAIADCLMPGAYLFVFAGGLNDDLISVAMRRAGLVKQHKALAWSQGSSLPKTTRVDSQVDAAAGKVQKIVGQKVYADGKTRRAGSKETMNEGYQRPWMEEDSQRSEMIREPATPLAETWAGHRYGAQALRNLIEAILIFRKPYVGKPYECIVRTGAGSLNIAGSRIGSDSIDTRIAKDGAKSIYGQIGTTDAGHIEILSHSGRHSSNFYPCHTDRCIPRGTKRVRASSSINRGEGSGTAGVISQMKSLNDKRSPGYADADGLETVSAWDCARDDSGAYICPVALLDEQAGELKTAAWDGRRNRPSESVAYGHYKQIESEPREASTGGPSRFSFCADWNHEARERLEAANAVRYQAKPSSVERDAGLCGHFPCTICGEYNTTTHMVTVDEKQEQRPCKRSIHPTRKPISLAKYLSTLLACPDAYAPRRLFVPFCGEGSEISGAILSGEWEQIVGVDTERAYVERARIAAAFWQNAIRYGQSDPAKILANAPESDSRQLDMFAGANAEAES